MAERGWTRQNGPAIPFWHIILFRSLRDRTMWFTETPWPPIVVCTVLGTLSLIAWRAHRRPRYLMGVPLCLVLSIAIYGLEKVIVTEREHVEIELRNLVDAFIEECETPRDVWQRIGMAAGAGPESKTLSYISPKAEEVRRQAIGALMFVSRIEYLRITDVSTAMKASNSRAIMHFRANAGVQVPNLYEGHHASRWELTWQREAGEWKVIRAQRLDPITGQEISILAPR
jgi:hypothetical protein